jgi:hypothetical protein
MAALAFSADLITIALFLRDLFIGNPPIPFSSTLSRVALIVTIFAFAYLLLMYSRQAYESLDAIIWVFSWLYIVFASAVFALVAYRFLVEANYGPGEFVGYIALIALIAWLGFMVALINKKRTGYFSVPFMLVALEQMVVWIVLISSRRPISFNLTFVGNLLLFVYASTFVLFFIVMARWER